MSRPDCGEGDRGRPVAAWHAPARPARSLKGSDVTGREFRGRARARDPLRECRCSEAGGRAGAGRGELGGRLHDRCDRRQFARPERSAGHAPHLRLRGGDGGLHPAGRRIARRHGRRAAFLAGTGCDVLAGLLAAVAVVLGSFMLFCAGTFFGGAYGPLSSRSASPPPIASRPTGAREPCPPSWRAGCSPGSSARNSSPSPWSCGSHTCSRRRSWRKRLWRPCAPSSCSKFGSRCPRRRRWPAAARSAPSCASPGSSPP